MKSPFVVVALLSVGAPTLAGAAWMFRGGTAIAATATKDLPKNEVAPIAPRAAAGPSVVSEARVKVPAATFTMGSEKGAADERPVHDVSVDAFEMDRYEVTNGRYEACVKSGACTAPPVTASRTRKQYFGVPQFADHPVVFVAWAQAKDYCAFAGGRLPTEAEWERAARGTDKRTYPWGEAAPRCDLANFAGCVGDTDRVGLRIEGASPVGAEDMAGNVWEWTADAYDPMYYARSPKKNPSGPETGALRVARGGCFMAGADSLRTTCRKAELASSFAPNVGFRCVYPAASAHGTSGGAK